MLSEALNIRFGISFPDNFPVPIFISETGCNMPGPRIWDDTDAIFSEPIVKDWSGAIMYEWIQEQSNYCKDERLLPNAIDRL